MDFRGNSMPYKNSFLGCEEVRIPAQYSHPIKTYEQDFCGTCLLQILLFALIHLNCGSKSDHWRTRQYSHPYQRPQVIL